MGLCLHINNLVNWALLNFTYRDLATLLEGAGLLFQYFECDIKKYSIMDE